MAGELVKVDPVGGGERFERTHATAIPKSKLFDLTDLALLLRHLSRVHTEGASIGELVEVVPRTRIGLAEGFEFPLFAREPRKNASFNVREVSDDKVQAFGRADHATQCRAHECIRFGNEFAPPFFEGRDTEVDDFLLQRRAR